MKEQTFTQLLIWVKTVHEIFYNEIRIQVSFWIENPLY